MKESSDAIHRFPAKAATLQPMSKQLTAEDFKESLNAHVAAKGTEIREHYGPHIGWRELVRILGDRSVVRYPCEIVFDAALLLPGEFAHAQPNSDNPQD